MFAVTSADTTLGNIHFSIQAIEISSFNVKHTAMIYSPSTNTIYYKNNIYKNKRLYLKMTFQKPIIAIHEILELCAFQPSLFQLTASMVGISGVSITTVVFSESTWEIAFSCVFGSKLSTYDLNLVTYRKAFLFRIF